MPDNPWIWLLAIVVVGAVVLFALRRGGNVQAGVGPTSLKFEARKEPEGTDVSVLDAARIEESAVGDVTGLAEASPPARQTRVDVAKGAKITGSTVGDISGVRREPGKPGSGA